MDGKISTEPTPDLRASLGGGPTTEAPPNHREMLAESMIDLVNVISEIEDLSNRVVVCLGCDNPDPCDAKDAGTFPGLLGDIYKNQNSFAQRLRYVSKNLTALAAQLGV